MGRGVGDGAGGTADIGFALVAGEGRGSGVGDPTNRGAGVPVGPKDGAGLLSDDIASKPGDIGTPGIDASAEVVDPLRLWSRICGDPMPLSTTSVKPAMTMTPMRAIPDRLGGRTLPPWHVARRRSIEPSLCLDRQKG
ncbi:MAG: hypothetical protein ACHQNA_10590 [Acidimicrobiales bacterium]